MQTGIFTIDIRSLTQTGEGVGDVDGFLVFVPGALPGERAEIGLHDIRKRFGRAKLRRLLVTSPHRVTPRCPVFGVCGGCALQHWDYQKQLQWKTDTVREALSRIGKLQADVQPCIAGLPWHYRNKASWPAAPPQRFGFYRPNSHDIVETPHCFIQDPHSQTVMASFKRFMQKYDIAAYDEQNHSGLVKHLVTRITRQGELMVLIVATGDIPHWRQWADELSNLRLPAQHGWPETSVVGLALQRNTQRGNAILQGQTQLLWGCGTLTEKLCGLQFELSPTAFFQVNPPQAERLYTIAAEMAQLFGNETLCDLYCGTGTIGLSMAANVKSLHGIEISSAAIADARRNAQKNGIHNATFEIGKAEEAYTATQSPDIVVLDPPRKGCDPSLLAALLRHQSKRVIYISCNPATLARDLAELSNGYHVEAVQPVDMFAQTGHVETVVSLQRKGS